MHQNQTPAVTNQWLYLYGGSIFLISWALQGLAIATTSDINSDAAELWLVGTMLVPAFVTIGFLVMNKSLRGRILWKPTRNIFGLVLAAVLVPTLIAFVVLAILQHFGYGVSGWFTFATSGVNISGGPYLLGSGQQSWALFALNILVTAIFYSFLNAIPAAGEEFAWRGFLQGLLVERFGTLKALTLLGFIWSMWHLPAQLAGYNYPEYPIVGSLLISPLELIATSFFFGLGDTEK